MIFVLFPQGVFRFDRGSGSYEWAGEGFGLARVVESFHGLGFDIAVTEAPMRNSPFVRSAVGAQARSPRADLTAAQGRFSDILRTLVREVHPACIAEEDSEEAMRTAGVFYYKRNS